MQAKIHAEKLDKKVQEVLDHPLIKVPDDVPDWQSDENKDRILSNARKVLIMRPESSAIHDDLVATFSEHRLHQAAVHVGNSQRFQIFLGLYVKNSHSNLLFSFLFHALSDGHDDGDVHAQGQVQERQLPVGDESEKKKRKRSPGTVKESATQEHVETRKLLKEYLKQPEIVLENSR